MPNINSLTSDSGDHVGIFRANSSPEQELRSGRDRDRRQRCGWIPIWVSGSGTASLGLRVWAFLPVQQWYVAECCLWAKISQAQDLQALPAQAEQGEE